MKTLSLFVLALALSSPTWAQSEPVPSTPVQTKEQVTLKKVSLNDATAQELAELKSIGLKKAQRIVTYRIDNGNFKSIDDLVNVKGIGKGILEKNRDRLVLAQQ